MAAKAATAKMANGRKIKRLAQGFANEQSRAQQEQEQGRSRSGEGWNWCRDDRQLAAARCEASLFLFYAKCTKNIFKFISFFLK